jgi:hypothetical protein
LQTDTSLQTSSGLLLTTQTNIVDKAIGEISNTK